MVQAALNGGHPAHVPGVPITPNDLANSAKDAVNAGATSLHMHPRDALGNESLFPQDVEAALCAIRAAVPGVPVGIGTGAWILPDTHKKYSAIKEWDILPDFVSINLNEEDAPVMCELMSDLDIGIEAGVWTNTDAERLMTQMAKTSLLRILVEVHDMPAPKARQDALEILGTTESHDTPKLLHGENQSAWQMQHLAAQLELDTRIGLEDTLHMLDGSPADSNAALIKTALHIRQGV